MGAGDRSGGKGHSGKKEKHVDDHSRHPSGGSKGTSDRQQSDKPAGPRHKSNRKASYSALPEYLPSDLGFLWRIEPLEIDYKKVSDKRMVGIEDGNSNDFYQVWLPPLKSRCFEITSSGNIYRWRPEGSKLCSVDVSTLEEYSKVSMFYQARQDNLLAVPYDCTEKDVKGQDDGWSSISFCHIKRSKLSAVALGAGAEPTLAVPAVGTTWMPQVVPKTYSPSVRGPLGRSMPVAPNGGLCGSLALLIAMAGFSAEENDAEHAVQHGFLMDRWEPQRHPIDIGRQEERGMVVTTWLDPGSRSTTKQLLESWERGDYGPIWSAHPVGASTGYVSGRGGEELFSSQQRGQVMDDDIDNNEYLHEPGLSRAYPSSIYPHDSSLPDRSATPRRMEQSTYSSAGGSSHAGTYGSSDYDSNEQGSSYGYGGQGHASQHEDFPEEDDIYGAD